MARCLKAMRVSCMCIECTAAPPRARALGTPRWSQLDRAGAWSGRRLYGPRSRRSPPPSYRLGRGVLGRRSIILVCGGSCSDGLGRLDQRMRNSRSSSVGWVRGWRRTGQRGLALRRRTQQCRVEGRERCIWGEPGWGDDRSSRGR